MQHLFLKNPNYLKNAPEWKSPTYQQIMQILHKIEQNIYLNYGQCIKPWEQEEKILIYLE